MSAVLSRLVARAKGTHPPRITPRVPSRFEGDRNQGEMAIEASSSPGDATISDAPPPPAPRTAQNRPAPAQKTSANPRAATQDPVEPASSPQPAQAAQPVSDKTTPARHSAAPPPPLIAPSSVHIGPPRTAIDTAAPPATITAPEQDSVPPDPVTPPAKVPAPLLATPTDAPDLTALANFLDGKDEPELPPALTAPSSPVAPAPPDITVHIGQIDIRTDQAVKKPPQTAKRPAAATTDLSDYLRARGPRR